MPQRVVDGCVVGRLAHTLELVLDVPIVVTCEEVRAFNSGKKEIGCTSVQRTSLDQIVSAPGQVAVAVVGEDGVGRKQRGESEEKSELHGGYERSFEH